MFLYQYQTLCHSSKVGCLIQLEVEAVMLSVDAKRETQHAPFRFGNVICGLFEGSSIHIFVFSAAVLLFWKESNWETLPTIGILFFHYPELQTCSSLIAMA